MKSALTRASKTLLLLLALAESDTNLLSGFAYHRGLLAMTYAQIPRAAVLKAATIDDIK